eukprot:546753-Pelagomonas_calceolata.AAC.3
MTSLSAIKVLVNAPPRPPHLILMTSLSAIKAFVNAPPGPPHLILSQSPQHQLNNFIVSSVSSVALLLAIKVFECAPPKPPHLIVKVVAGAGDPWEDGVPAERLSRGGNLGKKARGPKHEARLVEHEGGCDEHEVAELVTLGAMHGVSNACSKHFGQMTGWSKASDVQYPSRKGMLPSRMITTM